MSVVVAIGLVVVGMIVFLLVVAIIVGASDDQYRNTTTGSRRSISDAGWKSTRRKAVRASVIV